MHPLISIYMHYMLFFVDVQMECIISSLMNKRIREETKCPTRL